MRLAIELALQNLERRTGGPFGAGVFERDTGRLVALGVNLVEPAACSIAHAEAVAVALAQQVRKTHDLAAPGLPPVELVCSAQPCCQCFGIVWWSGVTGLVIGARAEDVEGIAGFHEGPLPPAGSDCCNTARAYRRSRSSATSSAWRPRRLSGPIEPPARRSTIRGGKRRSG